MRGLVLRLVAAAALTLAACASPDWSHGLSSYRQGRFDLALGDFEPLARSGNPYAQFMMGTMYLRGEGVPRDPGQAVRWFRQAADTGEPNSQGALGVLYKAGQGVSQDRVEAYKWISLSLSNSNLATADKPRLQGELDSLAKLMSPADVERGTRLFKEWRAGGGGGRIDSGGPV
jgi:TPR repeat protein